MEVNPGPQGGGGSGAKELRKRYAVTTWIVYNIEPMCKIAQVGSDGSCTARVERLLGVCRADSLAAQQVCDVFVETEAKWHPSIREAESAATIKYDYERTELDAAQTQLKTSLMAIN